MEQNVTDTTLSIENLEKVLYYESLDKLMITKAWEEDDSYIFKFMDGRFPPVNDGIIKLHKKPTKKDYYRISMNDGYFINEEHIHISDIKDKFKFISKVSKFRFVKK